MYGLGTRYKDKTVIESRNVSYTNIEYPSTNQKTSLLAHIKDLIALRRDIKDMNDQGQIVDNTQKITKVKDSLYKIIQNEKGIDGRHFVIIGFSHGSLILYTALIQLMSDIRIPTNEFVSIFKRIHFYTVGSPYNPSPNFLRPFEDPGGTYKMCNFYYHNDWMLKMADFIMPLQFPSKKTKSTMQSLVTVDTTKMLLFDEDQRNCVVAHPLEYFHNSPKAFKVVHVLSSLLYPLFINTGTQNHQLKTFFSLFYYLTQNCKMPTLTPDQYEIFNEILSQTINFQVIRKLIEIPTDVVQGGNKNWIDSKRYIVYNKRTFVVRYDKQLRRNYIIVKKIPVYLSDIRGKYHSVSTMSSPNTQKGT